MRKLLFMTAALSLVAVAGCRCLVWSCKETPESLVQKMQQALDPSGKAKTIKSALVIYESQLGKKKSTVTLKIESPASIRLEVCSGNDLMIKACSGNVGWEYVNKTGLRRLTDKELNELEFQAVYLAPNVNFKKLFAKIKIDGEEKAAGIECWKLVCTPQPKFKSQPIIMWVDKENYMVVKTLEKYDMANEVVDISTYFGDYELFDGIMVPKVMVSQIGNRLMESNLVSVEWNAKFAKSQFAMPKKLASAK